MTAFSLRWVALCVYAPFVLALSSCGEGNIQDNLEDTFTGGDTVYQSSQTLPPLEIPPDLSSSTIQPDNLSSTGGTSLSTTFSEYSVVDQDAASIRSGGVLPQIDGVRIERSGNERWLVVKASPSEVWPKIRDFWLESGFVFVYENPTTGIMETDWAEQSLGVKPGFFGKLFTKIRDKLYGPAIRDKYRVRLERGVWPGTTEIYVSHRGVEQVSQSLTQPKAGESDVQYVWQPRPSDPGLESEMLARMMIAFGVQQESARQVVASAPEPQLRAQVVRDGNGAAALALRDNFSRAWRRTGLALDRVGFTVEDRDRSQGLYYVRYVDPQKVGEEEEAGFFSKLKFWGDGEASEDDSNEYLISLIAEGSDTQVVVLDKEGNRDASSTADRILSLLHEQLK